MSPDPSHHQPSEAPPHTASDAIPNLSRELLEELRQADVDLAGAAQERERAIDTPSYSTTPRNQATSRVAEAEKHVEDVTEKIDRILSKANQPPTTPPAAVPATPTTPPQSSPAQSD